MYFYHIYNKLTQMNKKRLSVLDYKPYGSTRIRNYINAIVDRCEQYATAFKTQDTSTDITEPPKKKPKKNCSGYTKSNIDTIITNYLNVITDKLLESTPTDYKENIKIRINELQNKQKPFQKTIQASSQKRLALPTKKKVDSKTFDSHQKAITQMAIKYAKKGDFHNAEAMLKMAKKELEKETEIDHIYPGTPENITILTHLAVCCREIALHGPPPQDQNKYFQLAKSIFRKIIRIPFANELTPLLYQHAKSECQKTLQLEASICTIKKDKSKESRSLLKLLTIIAKDKLANFTTYINLSITLAHLDIMQKDDLTKTKEDDKTALRWDYANEKHMPKEVIAAINNNTVPLTAQDAFLKAKTLASTPYENLIIETLEKTLNQSTYLSEDDKESLPWVGLSPSPLNLYAPDPSSPAATLPIASLEPTAPPPAKKRRTSARLEGRKAAASAVSPIPAPKKSIPSIAEIGRTVSQLVKLKKTQQVLKTADGNTKTVSAECLVVPKPSPHPQSEEQLSRLRKLCIDMGFVKFKEEKFKSVFRTYWLLGNLLIPQSLNSDSLALISVLLFENDAHDADTSTKGMGLMKQMFEALEKGTLNGKPISEDAHPHVKLANYIHQDMKKREPDMSYWKPVFDSLRDQKIANIKQKKYRQIAIERGLPIAQYDALRFDESGVQFLLIYTSLLIAKQIGHSLDHNVFKHPQIKELFKLANTGIVSPLNDLDSENKTQADVKDEEEPFSEPYQRFIQALAQKHGSATFNQEEVSLLKKLEPCFSTLCEDQIDLTQDTCIFRADQLQSIKSSLNSQNETFNLLFQKKAPYNPFKTGYKEKDIPQFKEAYQDTATKQNKALIKLKTRTESFCFQQSTPRKDTIGIPGHPIAEKDIHICLVAVQHMLLLNHWSTSKYNARYHEGMLVS